MTEKVPKKLKANFSKKPAKKIFSLHGGKIEFYITKFKFYFPAMAGFLEKFAFSFHNK